MSENLNKKPPKGILKSSSSFDTNSFTTPRGSITSLGGVVVDEEALSPNCRKKSAKFDEMNIIETLHPPDKDYGHMKIEEPKTPFNYYEENEEIESSQNKKEILLDPEELARKIKEKGGSLPSFLDEDEEEEEEGEEEASGSGVEGKKYFESKRKAHYNEYFAVKLARQLMDDDDEEEEKFIPSEETDLN